MLRSHMPNFYLCELRRDNSFIRDRRPTPKSACIKQQGRLVTVIWGIIKEKRELDNPWKRAFQPNGMRLFSDTPDTLGATYQ